MKLLLDEHFSKRVAAAIREDGYDVVAVTEHEDLRGLRDTDLFEWARSAGYVIVTQDYGDFAALIRESGLNEMEYPGIIFVPKRLWASIADLERFVGALAHFLDEHEDDAVRGLVAWLT